MKTLIYMVRHGESNKKEGNERTRGLTDKGAADARKVTELLINAEIDTLISSPYVRAVLTIEELAQKIGKDIVVIEDLRERDFSIEENDMMDKELYPAVKMMFSDPYFSFPGGESNMACQERALSVLKDILMKYRGEKIVIGTHGIVMTLMMNYFDPQYGLDFLIHTSKPDVYIMEFDDDTLIDVKRLWGK